MADERQPGWREVVLVAVAVVAAVVGAAVVTSFLPADIQKIVYDTPFAIGFLIFATAWFLWRVSRRGGDDLSH